jgi:hypothetical protein
MPWKEATCANAPIPVIRLEVSSYDPRGETVRLEAELCMSESALRDLRGIRSERLVRHHSGFALTSSGQFYTSLRLVLQGYPSLENTQALNEVTVGHIVQAAYHFVDVGTVQLPVEGAAARYPFDSYGTTQTLSLAAVAPNAGGFPTSRHSPHEGAAAYPRVALEVYRGPALTPLALVPRQVHLLLDNPPVALVSQFNSIVPHSRRYTCF